MHVVTVAAAGQGMGATMLTAWLRHYAAEEGPRLVVALDAGRGAALSAWARRAGPSRSVAAAWDESCTPDNLRRLEDEGVGLVLIDCDLSQADARVSDILEASDVVVIVVQPRGTGLDHLGELIDIADAASKPFVFVINQATHDEDMTAATVVSLAQYGTVSPIILPRYEDCRLPRCAESENGSAESALLEDTSQLWHYLQAGLEYMKETEAKPEQQIVSQMGEMKYDKPATFVVPEMVYPCHVIDITSQGLVFTSEKEIPPGLRIRMSLPYVGQIDCEVTESESGKMNASFVIDEARRTELLDQVALLIEYGRDREPSAAAPTDMAIA